MPRLDLYPLFLAYLQDSLTKRKLAASSRSAAVWQYLWYSQFCSSEVGYPNQRHMEPFGLIEGQALYGLSPTIAKLTIFTAISIATHSLARAMLA